MDLKAIQQALADQGCDGWLFYDFRGSDPLARSILGLSASAHHTRRWYYFVPRTGEPTRIVHAIESGALDALPGSKRVYLPWQQLEQTLRETLAGARTVAMQYSPANAIPYVSRVDAGTIEFIRGLGVEIVTSADLVARFEATIDEEQWGTHVFAASALERLIQTTFAEIGRRVAGGSRPTETEIQGFMADGLAREGLVTDHPPIVAVNAHSADPHFAPPEEGSAAMGPGDFVLLDVWARRAVPRAIYADYTWVGVIGSPPTAEQAKVFEIVARARDAAVESIRDAQSQRRPIRGCDVDDICRGVIADAGFGEFFIHRTGHSIHEVGHGAGANIDNLETRDERRLLPRTLFSIEPGVYLPGKFGVRSEIDVYLPSEDELVVTGPAPQAKIVEIPIA